MVTHWVEVLVTQAGITTPLTDDELRKLDKTTRAKLLKEMSRLSEILKWDWYDDIPVTAEVQGGA